MNQLKLRQELAARLQATFHALKAQLGQDVTLNTLAFWLSTQIGQEAAYSASTVHRLLNGQADPSIAQIFAFSAVCAQRGLAVDPGWLAFGAGSSAAAPSPVIVNAVPLYVASTTQVPKQRTGPKPRAARGRRQGELGAEQGADAGEQPG